MNVLLIVLSILWMMAASVTDIKKREVSDWLSFSLFAIGFFFLIIQAVTEKSYEFLIPSAIIFGIFLIIANLLYYLGIFGGGDAKLLIALSIILPQLTFRSILNLPSAVIFLLNCLLIGSIYGMIYSIILAFKYRYEFRENLAKIKFPVLPFLIISIAIAAISFFSYQYLLIFAVMILLFPLLFIFTKAVENVALIKTIETSKLTEGDWLAQPIKVGSKIINAKSGLTVKEIEFIKRHKTHVTIKEGIPFVPVFLIAFLLSLWIGNLLELFIII
jgi:preflagellin peptidase FlaK